MVSTLLLPAIYLLWMAGFTKVKSWKFFWADSLSAFLSSGV